MLFRQFTPKACIEYDRLFHQAAEQDAYLPWDCLNNQIFTYNFNPSHAHPPPLRFMTKLRPFTMPSSSQLKIGSSNGITPFVSTVPFAVTAFFRDSGQQLAVDDPPLAFRLGPYQVNRFQLCHP